MELRLLAEERYENLYWCSILATLSLKLNPGLELSTEQKRLFHLVLDKRCNDLSVVKSKLEPLEKAWLDLARETPKVKTRIFATQAFFRLSDRSGLEVASLVVGGLIALGAVQMLFFYGAAAGQFVYDYWVWDDLVVQAINIAPIAAVGLVLAEAIFRLFRLVCEKSGLLFPLVFVLHHPVVFAFLLFFALLVWASAWGQVRGAGVLEEFKNQGGQETATMMDGTMLSCVHLVGTTSRAAVFLRAEQEGTDEQRVINTTSELSDDNSQGSERTCVSEVELGKLRYRDVAKRVFCTLPQDLRDWHSMPRRWCEDESLEPKYGVYVIDRDKIVCHARGERCKEIPRRWVIDGADGSDDNDGQRSTDAQKGNKDTHEFSPTINGQTISI